MDTSIDFTAPSGAAAIILTMEPGISATIVTVLVGQSTALREELTKFLRPPAFRVVTSRPSISEIGSGEFPQSDPCLLIIECSESSRLLIPQIAQIKQRNPLARIALLGHHWLPDEIAAAFQAGANAYFAEATASAEFQMAIELITQRPASPNAK